MAAVSSPTVETTADLGAHTLRTVSRFTYTTCYMISYGVVYASVFLAKSIPQNNPVIQGFIDGGHAAVEAVNANKSVAVAPTQALPG